MSPEDWLKQQGQSPKPMSPEEWAATKVAPSPVDFSVPTKENLAESARQAKERGKLAKKEEPSFFEQVLASPEVPISLLQNIPVGLGVAIATKGESEPMSHFMQKYGYKFKTRGGQAVAEKLGKALEGLPPVLGMGGAVGGALQTAAPSARQVATIPAVQKAAQKIGLTDLIKLDTSKASDLAKKLTGRKDVEEAEKAVKDLQKSLPSTLSEAEKTEIVNRARQERNLREAKSKFLTKAQQERETAARKFADLGTPSETQALGAEMQRRLTGTQFTREARVSQQAARDYEKYFEQAKGFEDSPARQVMLSELEAMSVSPSVGSAGRKYASQALKDLQESETALGAEKEFRKYFEQGSAPQQAGYGAIEQQANRDVSDIISKALNDHAPYRIQTRQTYKEFKTPLDAYETLFGKKGVAREKVVPDRVQMMATDYPANYFKNKDTINSLREQLAGDEAAVRKFANQHVVNELQGKTADQADAWFKKNSEWINSVEGLNTRVSRYVDSLKNAEMQAAKLEEQAKKIGGKVEDVVSRGASRANKLAEFKEQLNLYPEKATSVANNMIDYLLKNKLLSTEKLQLLKSDVDAANKLTNAVQKQKELRNAFIRYGVISAGGGYATYKLGQSIF